MLFLVIITRCVLKWFWLGGGNGQREKQMDGKTPFVFISYFFISITCKRCLTLWWRSSALAFYYDISHRTCRQQQFMPLTHCRGLSSSCSCGNRHEILTLPPAGPEDSHRMARMNAQVCVRKSGKWFCLYTCFEGIIAALITLKP